MSSDPLLACRLALAVWGLGGQGRDGYPGARSQFVHLGTGELGTAIEASLFEAMLAADAGDTVALIGLANLHRRAGRLHTAESLCRAVLDRTPGLPFAEGRLASILAEQGKIHAADALFRSLGARFGGVEAAIRLAPDFVSGLRRPTDAEPASVAGIAADFVALTGGDAGYFHRFSDALANSLAASAAKSGRAILLHFHIVDPDPAVEQRLAAMQTRLPELAIRFTVETSPTELTPQQRRTFYACARFLRLPRLLAVYRCPILLLDIDAVVLRDPLPLVEALRHEGADLALVRGPTRDPWCTFWADAILIAPSQRAADYAALVAGYIGHFLERGEAAWFLDQIALYAAWVCGYRDRPAPVMLAWPSDVQNTRTDLAYFWSLHMSQPSNAAGPDSPHYRRYRDNEI